MYERLHKEAARQEISIYEKSLHHKIKGLYADNVIWINRGIPTNREKTCILAEELGHYYTTAGDITDQSDANNRKQERRAREWAYEKLVPLKRIVEAHQACIRSRHELAEYLGVTEEFLQAALHRYLDKHGPYVVVDDRHTVMFDPLMVIEQLERMKSSRA